MDGGEDEGRNGGLRVVFREGNIFNTNLKGSLAFRMVWPQDFYQAGRLMEMHLKFCNNGERA
jgi:hypothetical protein